MVSSNPSEDSRVPANLLYFSNEYLFASSRRSDSCYYAWPQLLPTPPWTGLKGGAVAQHTQAYETKVDMQRGFLIGISHESSKTHEAGIEFRLENCSKPRKNRLPSPQFGQAIQYKSLVHCRFKITSDFLYWNQRQTKASQLQ
jgi:hypothetical protein